MIELKIKIALSREQEVQQAVKKKFVQGLQDCKDIILPIAQALAFPHIYTGRYFRSLSYRVSEERMMGSLHSGGKIAPHAHLVEYGTDKMEAQGILRKAAEQARPKMGEVIARRMREPL